MTSFVTFCETASSSIWILTTKLGHFIDKNRFECFLKWPIFSKITYCFVSFQFIWKRPFLYVNEHHFKVFFHANSSLTFSCNQWRYVHIKFAKLSINIEIAVICQGVFQVIIKSEQVKTLRFCNPRDGCWIILIKCKKIQSNLS